MRLALAGSRETSDTPPGKSNTYLPCEGFHRRSDRGHPIGDIELTGINGIT